MFNNIDNLPVEMQFYINCNRGFDVREQLFEDFKINDDKNGAIVLSCLEDLYVNNISIENLDTRLSGLSLTEEKRKQFLLELLGRYLLVIDDYYGGKISEQIKILGGKPEAFQKYVNDFENDWLQESDKYIEEGEILPEDNGIIDVNVEKKEIASQLSDNLRYLLLAETVDANNFLEQANWLLGYVLSVDPESKDNFIKSLIDNQTDLTEFVPVGEGEEAGPITIANWLADYLNFAGGRFNDNLMAARYVIESPQVKKLSEPDKARVKNLIALYRNLFNFPANYDANHPERTQFFPIDLLKVQYGNLEEPVAEKSKITEQKKEVVKEVVKESVKPIEKKEETPISLAGDRYKLVIDSIKIKEELIKTKNGLVNITTEQLIGMWRNSFSNHEAVNTVAAMMELFKRPNFSSQWFMTPEIREILSAQTVAYPSLAEPSIREGAIKSVVIAVVTKAILQRLEFSDEQAAVLFLQISSHDPKLTSFVYFDAKQGKFTWRQFADK